MKVKTCACGWQFMTLNNDVVLCPQCRPKVIKSKCICCGNDIDMSAGNKKYCSLCRVNSKKIYDREFIKFKRSPIKNIVDNEMLLSDHLFTTLLCNQDCENCKHPDCILPE